MALTPINYIDNEGLVAAVKKITAWADSEKSLAIKTILTKDNSILFFKKPNALDSDAPTFKIDFPVEYFLDQANTTFVDSFTWSDVTYPGSTDPSLNTQPVLVLALKGDNGTIKYSFVSLLSLVNIYKASTTTSTVTVSIDDSTNTISATVNISADNNNLLKVGSDGGLFAEASDDTKKADKLTADVLEGQILTDDGTGNLKASGVTIQNIMDNFVPYTAQEVETMLNSVL